MQDVGSKEDTELSRVDLALSWRELLVEPLGHCQSIGKLAASVSGIVQSTSLQWQVLSAVLNHKSSAGIHKSLRRQLKRIHLSDVLCRSEMVLGTFIANR
jgi:hypothetical protein